MSWCGGMPRIIGLELVAIIAWEIWKAINNQVYRSMPVNFDTISAFIERCTHELQISCVELDGKPMVGTYQILP